MVYADYKKWKITIGHLWFSTKFPVNEKKPSILYQHGCEENLKGFGIKSSIQHTLITDLTVSEEDLYKKIRKNYRYEIRRAEKEGVELHYYSADEMKNKPELLNSFARTYNQMYADKNMSVSFNRKLIEAYMHKNGICFTVGFYQNEPLVFHSYIKDENHVRFFYSASPFRAQKELSNVIARMNKALHWHDLKKFKEMGIQLYDWGGIANPEQPNGIDEFKMGFGGAQKDYYNIIRGMNILTNLAMFVYKFRK